MVLQPSSSAPKSPLKPCCCSLSAILLLDCRFPRRIVTFVALGHLETLSRSRSVSIPFSFLSLFLPPFPSLYTFPFSFLYLFYLTTIHNFCSLLLRRRFIYCFALLCITCTAASMYTLVRLLSAPHFTVLQNKICQCLSTPTV